MVSSTTYFLHFIVPSYFLSLLGIFPVAIGFKKLVDLRRDDNREKEDVELDGTSGYWRNVFQVASVTFTNGGDNLGVYGPLFAGMSQLYNIKEETQFTTTLNRTPLMVVGLNDWSQVKVNGTTGVVINKELMP